MATLLSRARDTAFVLSIFAFFAGFTYRYWYLGYFGIPAGVFPTSVEETLSYSYSVFSAHIIWIAVIFVLLAATRLLRYRFGSLPQTADVIVLVALVVAAFPVINWWSQQTAYADFLNQLDAPSPQLRIILHLAPRVHIDAPGFARANSQGCLALIETSSTMFYVLVKEHDASTTLEQYVEAIPIASVERYETPLFYKGSPSYAKQCLAS